MKKRLFEILDEMCQADEENKTATCGLCPDMVGARTAKGGAEITMGVPADVGQKIMLDSQRYRPVLLVIDMDEYKKREAQ